MKKIAILLIVVVLYSICLQANAQSEKRLSIRIFSTNNITQADVVASFGSYVLDDKTQIKKQDKVNLAVDNGKVKVSIGDKVLYSKDSVRLSSQDLKCFLQIIPANAKMRRYDNDLIVKLSKDKKTLLLLKELAFLQCKMRGKICEVL